MILLHPTHGKNMKKLWEERWVPGKIFDPEGRFSQTGGSMMEMSSEDWRVGGGEPPIWKIGVKI